MPEEEVPPLLSPEARERIIELLGGEARGAEAERFVAERRDVFPQNIPLPWPKLSEEQANQILCDLQLGQEICQQVLAGQEKPGALKEWLGSIQPTWAGWFLSAFDRVIDQSLLQVRGSGKRGRQRKPPPESLPDPASIPGGIPSMIDAAFLAQPGRIDLAILTSPFMYKHGPAKPIALNDDVLAPRYSWQIDFAIQALKTSNFSISIRPGPPTTNVPDTGLVIRLAYLWKQAHHDWPIRQAGWGKPERGPFLVLATLCLRPFRPLHPTSTDVGEIVRNVLQRLPE